MDRGIVRYVLSGSLIAAVVSAGCSGDAESQTSGSPQGSTPLATARILSTMPQPAIPQLSEEHHRQIREIVAGDARLKALIGTSVADLDAAISSSEVTLWHSGEMLIGGVLTVPLPGPRTIGGEWLMAVAEDDDWTNPLTVARYRATYEGVTGVDVFVDLRDGSVVRIDPAHRTATLVDGPHYLDPIPSVPRRPD